MKARSWWPALALVAPALVLFAPWLVEGRILSSQDIARVYTPIAALLRECLQTGDPSRLIWNRDLGAGFPLVADGATTPFYLPHWLLLLALPPAHALTAALLLGYAASAVAMGLFARTLGLPAAASVVAGTGYAWCGFAVGHVVHVNVVAGLPFVPLVLIALEHAARRASVVRPAVVAGLAWGLQCLGGHPQVALMTAAIAIAYVPWRFRLREPVFSDDATPRGWRAVLPVLAVFLAVGAGTAAVYTLPMAELAAQSVAPGSGFHQPASATYALPAAHLVTAVAPFFFYDASGEYQGAWNPAEMAFYPGVVILWLAGISLALQWRVPRVRFFAAVAASGLLLALGDATPAHWLLQVLPVFRSMRAPARYVLLSDLALCLLAAFGTEALVALNARQRRWATSAALALAALALGASFLPPTVFGPLAGDRWRDAQAGGVSVLWPLRHAWPAILSCAAAAAVVVFARRRALLGASVAALVVLDLGVFAATALGPQWVTTHTVEGGFPKGGRAYVVTSPEPWRGASNRALIDGYAGLDLYVSLPLRRHVDYMQAFWLSDQTVTGLLQAAGVETVVDGWRRPLDPRSRLEDEEWSPRWPIATLLPGERVRFEVAGARADSLRLVTALQDAKSSLGSAVATVRLHQDHDAEATFDLRAGIETAERRADDADRSHPLPDNLTGWSRIDGLSEGRFYVARHDWDAERPVAAVEIEYRAPQGRLLLFGGSLRSSSTTLALTPFMAAPYRRREERAGQVVYDLTGARPRAMAVHHMVRVADAKAAIRRLGEPDADLAGTVALEGNDAPEPTGSGPSQVAVVSDEPGQVELTARMRGSGYVVLADAYYPGWTVAVDGSRATVYPADGLFRAVFVPDGTHRVVWRYEPRWLRVGLALTLATLAAALVLLVPRSAYS